MSDVQFDEPTYGYQVPMQRRDSLPTRLVLKMGVKREQVPQVLIGITVVAVLITLFVWFGGSKDSGVTTELTPEEQALLND